MVCARCQRPLRIKKPAYADKICDEGLALDDPSAAMAAAAPPMSGLARHSRERVRQLSRELRRSGSGGPTTSIPSPLASPHAGRRFEVPQNLFQGVAAATSPTFAPITAEPAPFPSGRARRPDFGQIAAWLIVFAGVLTLVGGLGVLGWSLAIGDAAYWELALGLTLGGQGLLIFGLVLAITRLWRHSRYSANKLQEVTTRLGQLQHTADSLLAKNSSGAPAFYADLVRGASPQVLLANLKGQVDQLATRLGSGL
jgi:hypothetical protein